MTVSPSVAFCLFYNSLATVHLEDRLLGSLTMQRFWATDSNRKCTVFVFNFSSHYHINVVKSLFTSRYHLFENLRETTVLAREVFTSGCCPWLKNVACLSSLFSSLIDLLIENWGEEVYIISIMCQCLHHHVNCRLAKLLIVSKTMGRLLWRFPVPPHPGPSSMSTVPTYSIPVEWSFCPKETLQLHGQTFNRLLLNTDAFLAVIIFSQPEVTLCSPAFGNLISDLIANSWDATNNNVIIESPDTS